MSEIREALVRSFGFSSFRGGQEAVVEALVAGHSSLALFPTGAGKSLCYQLPALLREGTALVISPLIALMKDQVESLRRRGIAAARLDSTLSPAELGQLYGDMSEGRLKLLYIAPERLANETFISRLKQMKISLLAIDEAHCISEWGHNFRPEYLRLAAVARDLKIGPVLALTATATPAVAEQIRAAFHIAPEHHIQTSFHRANLFLQITPVTAQERMEVLIKSLASDKARPAIVYVTLQETSAFVATRLQRAGLSARAYHAGLPDDQRAEAQEAFMSGKCDIMVATIAFGMGIDKADIRAVFHYNLPKTLENYLQETGRAGRDGAYAHCGMLACADDRIQLENFTYGDTPTPEAVRHVVDHLLRQGREFDISRYDLSQACDIRPLVIETILTYMELEGVIFPLGAFYTTCQVYFIRSEAQILSGHAADRKVFLQDVFRSGRMGRKYLTVDYDAAAAATDSPRERVQRALGYLEECGEIRCRPSGLRHRFRLCAEAGRRDPAEITARMTALFQERERRDIARMEEVLHCAAHPGCLTRLLLHRFGEAMETDCGHCSSCLSPGSIPRHIPESGLQGVTVADAAAMQQMRAARHPALRNPRQMARFFCGISSPGTTREKLTRHDFFGSMSGVPFQEVLAHAMTLPSW